MLFNFNLISIEKINILFRKKRTYLTFISLFVAIIGAWKDDFDFLFNEYHIEYDKSKRIAIEGRLEEIRDRWECDYVAINSFSKDEKKMKRYYEASAEYKISLKSEIAEYPVEPFNKSFFVLKKNKYLYVYDVNKYEKDVYLKNILSSVGIITILYVAIYSKEQIEKDGTPKLIGFLTYEFTDKAKTLTMKDISLMIKEKELLTNLL